MACSCGNRSHVDAILLGGPWDGQRFHVHDPPEPRISVPGPPPLAGLDPDSVPLAGEVPITDYAYMGIRDDGLRWYRAV